MNKERDWSKLAASPALMAQLTTLEAQCRNVGLAQAAGRVRHGVHALFVGPGGTAKTRAAEILAARLGRSLYRVDLSALVSQSIGETEKNLDRVFAEAAPSTAVLLLDEADALFGRRTDVRDSHDRYANLEIGYLLQKIESYQGLSILATNMVQHLDPAFLRRLEMIIEFPPPGAKGSLGM